MRLKFDCICTTTHSHKLGLKIFVEFKRFGRTRPGEVKSIEQLCKTQERKKAQRRARKQLKRQVITVI